MSQTKPLSLKNDVKFRFLAPGDVNEIKRLCHEWFPIDYPDNWFRDITASSKYYSLAATIGCKIIGMIIAEVKPRSLCNKEDMSVLASHFPKGTLVTYILSLAVVKEFRRHGIATLLLRHLLVYLTSDDMIQCKAVYLHVMVNNTSATEFYEMLSFQLHGRLSNYYSIKGDLYDGYLYVLYINGGQAPSLLCDCWKQVLMAVSRIEPCYLPAQAMQTLNRLWRCLVSGSNHNDYSTTW